MKEIERQDFQQDPATGFGPFTRREFLQYSGGGILVFFCMGSASAARGGQSAPSDFNAFLRIAEDGKVTCFTGKIEMGQGIITSLPQMLADELDVPIESVEIVMGDTALCPFDRGTFGSMTTRSFGPMLRKAAAEARGVLLELAAEQLGVPIDRLDAKDGAVVDRAGGGKKLTYAQLVQGKRIERHLEHEAPIKEPAQLKAMGMPRTRTDAHQKVTGKAQYAGDIRLPGMLYAKILRPPAHGAKLRSADTSAAEKIEGVQLVRDGDLIAVLHEKPDVAEEALDAIKAEFEIPPAQVDNESIFRHLIESASTNGREVQNIGDLNAGIAAAKSSVEKTYYNHYVAHAAIETHSALAQVEEGAVTVWASTQRPFGLREEAAETLGVPIEQVRVIAPFVGGGFGGKSRNQQAVEAVRLAKLAKRPVQVVWSRAEEFFYDSFRPAAVVQIRSGMDDAGKIVLWDYGVYYAGERGSACFYDVPNLRTLAFGEAEGKPDPHPFDTGAWRAPANNTNTFARESHIDIMAAQAGMDPVAFRLDNLKDERAINVLKAAAEKFGWTPSKAPSGRGFGVACGTDSGTYVATIAEAAVDKETGQVQVKRVVCAQDMGLVVNPEGAVIQIEGCITMGLGYALSEEVRFKGGAVLDTNFDTYRLPRFSWVPQIETVILDHKELSPQGGGEPAIITMGAVVANAIFDAVGARLFQLPMTAARVKEALEHRG